MRLLLTRRSVALCVQGAVASILCLPLLVAAQTQQEQNLFNTVNNRMQGHSGQMPQAIADATTSFSQNCWGMSFPCPRATPSSGSELTGVTFVVCMRLTGWQANQADPAEAGAYIWDSTPTVGTQNNVKTIRYDNILMIDPQVFAANENIGTVGMLLNEGLLYHEFLHGQLGIAWLQTQDAIGPACVCKTPDPGQHADGNHTQIPGFQDTLLENVAGLNGSTVRVTRQRIPAGGNGKFRVNLGRKNNWTGTAHIPRNGNVMQAEVSDPDNDGTILLTGMLANPQEGGTLFVLIDPPGDFLYFFIAVRSGAAAAPALERAGALAALLVLLALGGVALQEKNRCAVPI